MTRQSALVVGGGIIGSACALRLQQAGFETMLLDPESEVSPASWGNAGHLAVEQAEPLASRKTLLAAPRLLFLRGGPLDFRLRDAAAWVPFSLRFLRATSPAKFAAGTAALAAWLGEAVPAWRRLAADLGSPDLVVERGHFVVWEGAQTAARGVAAWSRANTGVVSFRTVSTEEHEQLAHLVRVPVAGAVRFEETGQIADLPTMHEALARTFEAAGGLRMRGAAVRLSLDGGRASVITRDGGILGADVIVIAAGVGSGAIFRSAGLKAPIIAERGYHIEGPGTDWPEGFPPVVFEDRSMIVTRFAGTLRASGFTEFGRAESPPDRRKWRRLRAHAAELGLPLGEPLREWMGARPTLPDYLPAIGRTAAARNLYYAFGHQHLGLTLAAITSEAVAGLVRGRPPRLDLTAFDLERFDGWRRPQV